VDIIIGTYYVKHQLIESVNNQEKRNIQFQPRYTYFKKSLAFYGNSFEVQTTPIVPIHYLASVVKMNLITAFSVT